jgi:hypothetical protein
MKYERAEALEVGLRRYGHTFADLRDLARTVAADPENHFLSNEDLVAFIVKTMAQAKRDYAKVVLNPPTYADLGSADCPSYDKRLQLRAPRSS